MVVLLSSVKYVQFFLNSFQATRLVMEIEFVTVPQFQRLFWGSLVNPELICGNLGC